MNILGNQARRATTTHRSCSQVHRRTPGSSNDNILGNQARRATTPHRSCSQVHRRTPGSSNNNILGNQARRATTPHRSCSQVSPGSSNNNILGNQAHRVTTPHRSCSQVYRRTPGSSNNILGNQARRATTPHRSCSQVHRQTPGSPNNNQPLMLTLTGSHRFHSHHRNSCLVRHINLMCPHRQPSETSDACKRGRGKKNGHIIWDAYPSTCLEFARYSYTILAAHPKATGDNCSQLGLLECVAHLHHDRD